MPNHLLSHWLLDPSVLFLNHGSFGATPRVVLEEQRELRDGMEREPVLFLARELGGRLDAVRQELGAFLHADSEGLALVPNVTAAVNAVLRSIDLAPGDELLTTDHEYGACRNALEYVASRTGARVVVANVPFPIADESQVTEAILARAGARTRLALVDHVTSQTGLVFPVASIVRSLAERGIDTFVDGAHAPGMLDLDVDAIGAAWYGGNLHKWVCAPKGAAFLHARRDRREGIHPPSISHGYGWTSSERSPFRLEFDWTGTDDPTAILSAPAAIRFLGSLFPGGWPELRRRNRDLALAGRERIALALGVALPAPASMIGSLAALPVPDGDGSPPGSPLYLDPLQVELFERHRIEVPVIPWPHPPRRLIRISAAAYNSTEDYDRLAGVLAERFGRSHA